MEAEVAAEEQSGIGSFKQYNGRILSMLRPEQGGKVR